MATAHYERNLQHTAEDNRTWRILKALGNPVRLHIVHFIQQHPRCIANEILLHLPDNCARAQSTLSQHLKVLRDADVLIAECDGSATCYTVNSDQIGWLREQIEHLQQHNNASR